MTNYDASPMSADLPISIEEVEALIQLEGKPILRDSRKILHLLGRMRIAIMAYRQQIRSLNNDIQTIRAQSERAGAATTLHPRDAVRFLSPDQLGELVEGHLRDQLASAQRSLADAKKTRSSANAELARVRFATASILEDASIPAEIRARFSAAMRTLPQGQPEPASGSPAVPAAQGGAQSNRAESIDDLGDLFS